MIALSSDGTGRFRHGSSQGFDEEFPYFLRFKQGKTEVPLFDNVGSKDGVTKNRCWHRLFKRRRSRVKSIKGVKCKMFEFNILTLYNILLSWDAIRAQEEVLYLLNPPDEIDTLCISRCSLVLGNRNISTSTRMDRR